MSKLLVVTAFCKENIPLLEKRAEYMRHLGVPATHDLLLVGDASIYPHELEWAEKLHAGLFTNVYSRRIPETPTSTAWPAPHNFVWRRCAKILAGRYGNPKFTAAGVGAWLYLEPDMTPINKNFLPILEKQYLFHKKPFMGVITSVEVKTTVKDKVTAHMVPHMNGGAVYPIDTRFYSQSTMIGDSLPWDVAGFAGNDLQKVAAIPNDVYVMVSRSYGYWKEDDKIVGAQKHRKTGEVERYVPVDLTKALIHHGCKDGSLMDTLMGVKTQAAVLHSAPEAVSLPPPAPPSIQSREDQIRADKAADMKWKDLIRKYKIAPRDLKKVLG